ncbi:ANTAR domain-containing protein [Streptomyces sp. NPDC001002]
MQRTAMLPKSWWGSRTEPPADDDRAGQDVDMACGMVMALAPCGRVPARNLLVDVARQCNTDLQDVAAALVAAWEGEPLPRLMRRGLRRALRRLYAEDRGCGRVPGQEPFGRGTP